MLESEGECPVPTGAKLYLSQQSTSGLKLSDPLQSAHPDNGFTTSPHLKKLLLLLMTMYGWYTCTWGEGGITPSWVSQFGTPWPN